MEIKQLVGWTPIEIYFKNPDPVVEWCDLRNIAFSEPFFEQTVAAHCLNDDSHCVHVQTNLEALAELHQINPGLEPTGFIFHTSKSGSTLVSRILAALPQNLVISEPDPIVSLLVGAKLSGMPEEQVIKSLRLLVSALGQSRLGVEKNYFIKFCSFNVLDLPIIRKAFPNVPSVFVYRHPVEVMISLLKRSAGWIDIKNTPQIVGMTGFYPKDIEKMSSEEYCARVLASYYQTMLEMADQDTLMLNYQQLPEAVWSSLPNFFQVSFSPEEKDHMRNFSQFYSKDPDSKQLFTNDSVAKQQEASEVVWETANRWLLIELYEKLQVSRCR
jgi:hypothetical protein